MSILSFSRFIARVSASWCNRSTVSNAARSEIFPALAALRSGERARARCALDALREALVLGKNVHDAICCFSSLIFSRSRWVIELRRE